VRFAGDCPVFYQQVTLRSRQWCSRGGPGTGGHPSNRAWVWSGAALPRVVPEVLVAVGLGLIGPVIWTSREAV